MKRKARSGTIVAALVLMMLCLLWLPTEAGLTYTTPLATHYVNFRTIGRFGTLLLLPVAALAVLRFRASSRK